MNLTTKELGLLRDAAYITLRRVADARRDSLFVDQERVEQLEDLTDRIEGELAKRESLLATHETE